MFKIFLAKYPGVELLHEKLPLRNCDQSGSGSPQAQQPGMRMPVAPYPYLRAVFSVFLIEPGV